MGGSEDDNLAGFNIVGNFDFLIPDWLTTEQTTDERGELPGQMI
jgi:hypothetical protein